MDFLSQTFTISVYYYMVKYAFESIGYDYYKGLKNKLPPVRYLGTDDFENDLVCLAHPKDFMKRIDLLKEKYELAIKHLGENIVSNINIGDVKNEILEIYPDTTELRENPNGFIALFVNNLGKDVVDSEFNKNDEVASISYLPVTANGIETTDKKLCGVIEGFVKKFNLKQHLVNKYQGLYLTVGEMKEMNIYTGETRSTEKFNIIGGKRSFEENSIESTIREAHEELGLVGDGKISKFIKIFLPKSNDVIRCSSFNVYCVHYSPKNLNNYDNYINSQIQN